MCRGEFPPEVDPYEVVSRYIKAIGKGILKVMSKMGISTYQSYCGAQIFDAVGLSSEFVDTYFTGTATMIEGVGLEEVAVETTNRHASRLFGNDPVLATSLDVGGEYVIPHARRRPCLDARCCHLQHAVRGNARTITGNSPTVNASERTAE
jgi:glutamate synthase (NADPH/NADH) large chain